MAEEKELIQQIAELKKLEYEVTGRDTWGMPKRDKNTNKENDDD